MAVAHDERRIGYARKAADTAVSALRGGLRRLVREPLARFLLVGLVIFLARTAFDRATTPRRIVITTARVAQLVDRYTLQFGARPDPRALKSLVGADVRDEILFREGLRRHLERDDEVVRRRIVEKMQFLSEDLDPPPSPTRSDLEAYFSRHVGAYRTPATVTFTQVYFSISPEAEESGRRRALRGLAMLPRQPRGTTRIGDPFPDAYEYSSYDAAQLVRLFGPSEIVDALFHAPVGQWSGPFRSAYGWHLAWIISRSEGKAARFEDVFSRVQSDYLADAKDRADRDALTRLAARYAVELPKGVK